MIKIPPDLRAEDVNQWVGDGVVLATLGEDSTLTPVLVSGVRTGNYAFLVGRKLGGDGAAITVPRESVYMTWPRCGAVNVGDLALYVQRRQVKQFRRTYTGRAITKIVPEEQEAARFLGAAAVAAALEFDRYSLAVFNPWYPSTDEGLASLNKGRFSVALSPTIIVTNGCGLYKHVYYNTLLVAKLVEGAIISLVPRLPRAVSKRLGGTYAAL